jgi:hypothetical protein
MTPQTTASIARVGILCWALIRPVSVLAATPICEANLKIFDEVPAFGTETHPLSSIFTHDFSVRGKTVVMVSTVNPNIVSTFAKTGVHAFFEPLDGLVKIGSRTVDAIYLDRSFRNKTPQEVSSVLRHCFHILKPGGKIFIAADSPTQKIFSPTYYLRYRAALDRRDPNPGYFEDIRIHTFDLSSLNRAILDAGFAVEQVDYSSHPERHVLLRDPGDTGMDGVYAIASKPASEKD